MDLSGFTKDGKFLMLALDHRSSFKKLLEPDDPDKVSDDEVVSLKHEIIDSVEDKISGLLIDETYGLEAFVHRYKPFLLPLEKSGFVGTKDERITELEYSVKDIIKMGAYGAKLLLYFNPHTESAATQMETASKIMGECKSNAFPFFLEIVTYGEGKNLVLESVKKFIDDAIIPDVWKLEYPGDIKNCREISELVGDIPWILLTGGSSYEVFVEHLKDAVQGGAKGFLAGRALWQEVCRLSGDEKKYFLDKTLPERFDKLSEIVLG